jgi:hypothetical protein
MLCKCEVKITTIDSCHFTLICGDYNIIMASCLDNVVRQFRKFGCKKQYHYQFTRELMEESQKMMEESEL